MVAIGKKRPTVTICPDFRNQVAQPIQKVLPVFYILKYLSMLDPMDHEVMKKTQGVKAY